MKEHADSRAQKASGAPPALLRVVLLVLLTLRVRWRTRADPGSLSSTIVEARTESTGLDRETRGCAAVVEGSPQWNVCAPQWLVAVPRRAVDG